MRSGTYSHVLYICLYATKYTHDPIGCINPLSRTLRPLAMVAFPLTWPLRVGSKVTSSSPSALSCSRVVRKCPRGKHDFRYVLEIGFGQDVELTRININSEVSLKCGRRGWTDCGLRNSLFVRCARYHMHLSITSETLKQTHCTFRVFTFLLTIFPPSKRICIYDKRNGCFHLSQEMYVIKTFRYSFTDDRTTEQHSHDSGRTCWPPLACS